MTVLQAFDLGDVATDEQHATGKPGSGATERDIVFYEWREWCKTVSAVVKLDGGAKAVPELLDWWREPDSGQEIFDFCMPGMFGSGSSLESLVGFLKESRRGRYSTVSRDVAEDRHGRPYPIEKKVYRAGISHFRLPKLVKYDSQFESENSDVVDLGVLCEGSRLRWDLLDKSHGGVFGQNGSGKSETDKSILTQLHLKGSCADDEPCVCGDCWALVIATPTEDDTTFASFARFPQHMVLCGGTAEHLRRLAEVMVSLDYEMGRRERERGKAGASWWGDDCGFVWGSLPRAERPVPFDEGVDDVEDGDGSEVDDGPLEISDLALSRKILVFFDESGDFVMPQPGLDDKAMVDWKNAVAALRRRQHGRGRKVRIHCLTSTQQSNVEAICGKFGGSALNEIGFLLVVRKMRKTFVAALFPDSSSDDVDEVLISGNSPVGRGVARGAMPPENLFADSVDDQAVQLSYMTPEQHERLLGRGHGAGSVESWGAYPDTDREVLEVDGTVVDRSGSSPEPLVDPARQELPPVPSAFTIPEETVIDDETAWPVNLIFSIAVVAMTFVSLFVSLSVSGVV